MIPKIIYTTWISDKPLPEKFNKYLESWARVMPDYKIKVLNLEELHLSPFTLKSIGRKNYALAGHYARVKALYDTGGIYFDVDVEAVGKFDELLSKKLVLGAEDNWVVNNAVIVAEKGHPYLKECLQYMDAYDFKNGTDIELETGPRMFTKLMEKRGFTEGKFGKYGDIEILPPRYFYPYHYTEKFTEACIKPGTLSIHHWAHSWNPKVSIVIPCYKQAQYLPDAIESALKQTYKQVEVIVVNDGSPDNTTAVAKRFPRVKVIEKPNGGLSSARNAGIKAATGGWILTLDADDKLDPTFIEKTINKADIVATEQREFGNSSRHWKPYKESPTYTDFIKRNQINCCSLFRREIWEMVGGYDEQMRDGYEDWEFWIRATRAGYKVKVVWEELFFYRKHGDSMVMHAQKNHDKIFAYMRSKNKF